MTKPTEQEIEYVARAMCAAQGHDPDETEGGGLTWRSMRIDAINFLAGWHAMKEWH